MDMLSYVMGSRSGGGGGSVEYPGYDLVVSIDASDSTAPLVLEKGSYSDIVAKIESNKLISGAIYAYDGNLRTTSLMFWFTYDNLNNWVAIHAYNFEFAETVQILLNSDNTVVWDE